MTVEQIRKACDAQPFVPFLLHVADGREIPVRSREFMGWVPGRTVTVHQPDGRRNVIDLLLITDLELDLTTSRSGDAEVPSPP